MMTLTLTPDPILTIYPQPSPKTLILHTGFCSALQQQTTQSNVQLSKQPPAAVAM